MIPRGINYLGFISIISVLSVALYVLADTAFFSPLSWAFQLYVLCVSHVRHSLSMLLPLYSLSTLPLSDLLIFLLISVSLFQQVCCFLLIPLTIVRESTINLQTSITVPSQTTV